MKAKTINVQIVKNLGNYETIRLGGEWELNGENLQDAIRAAVEELEQAWSKPKQFDPSVYGAGWYPQEHAPTPVGETPQIAEKGKELVRFKEEAKLLQAIVSRLQKDKTVTLETICKHYELDEDAQKCVEAAIKLRG